MNPDAHPGLAVKADIGAKLPWLGEIGIVRSSSAASYSPARPH